MKREFVYAENFEKCWKELKLSDKELQELEIMIINQPDTGDIIRDSGGLRKTRFGVNNRGKSGSIRILYVDFEFYETTYFLFAYPKNELETITDKQKQMFKQYIGILLDELKKKKGLI